MSDQGSPPFERDTLLDKPGIVGARWWHRSLVESHDAMSRRAAMKTLLIAGGAVAMTGVLVAMAASGSSSGSGSDFGDDYRTERRPSLDMQKSYGWSFGAVTENLTFNGESTAPFDRAALSRIDSDLRPGRADLAPYHVPTLFQVIGATPQLTPRGDPGGIIALSQALRPIFTPVMDVAYRRGKALALLLGGRVADVALVIDLPGPEAVAFAAGAATVFDPVFTFDNWPHPRGVVPAHLTLAAAAYYQPLFARRSLDRSSRSPPMFVLDRQRLQPYADDSTQFDNRHMARLPQARALTALGVKRVLYVTPAAGTLESDDLNDDFIAYAAAGLDVKLVAATSFGPDPNEPSRPADRREPDDGPAYYYGGSAGSHASFWSDYPWASPPSTRPGAPRPTPPILATFGKDYRPTPRATPFSSGSRDWSAPRPSPAGFGTVPVIVEVASGAILGARLSRSGTWNRASGGWGG